MLGIHISGGTAEGWFGQGEKSAIASVVIVVVLLILIVFGIIAIENAGKENNIAQPAAPTLPITPTVPAVVQSLPTAVNEPAPTRGVVKITATNLAKELLANWTKYDRGTTIFQVSGVLKWQDERFPNPRGDVSFFLGPAVKTSDGYELGVVIQVDIKEEAELFKTLAGMGGDRDIVIQGTYLTFANQNWGGAILENISLISVTPAK